MGIVRPLVIVAFVAASLLAQQPPSRKGLTAEQLVALLRVGEPSMSPDGSKIAFTVRTVDLAANKSLPTVYVVPTRGGPPRELGKGSQPCWGKDGASVMFATKDGVRMVSLADAAAVDLAIAGGVANLSVSPDGTRIAYTQDVKVDQDLHDQNPDLPLANARAYDDLMVRHWDHWRDGTYSHLFVRGLGATDAAIDMLQGQRVDTPLVPFGGPEQICWSPDGNQLVYTCKRVPDPEQSTDSGLYLAAADGKGEHKLLTSDMPGFDQDPVWSPDGSKIAFCSMARGGFESDRVRLMVHDCKTGNNRELLPDFDASAHCLRWTSDGKQLFFTVETEGTTQLYRTAVDAPKAVAVTRGRHALDALMVSPDALSVFALRTTMERPAEIVRVDVTTGAVAPLTEFNEKVYEQLSLPKIDGEWFPATDGKKIHAWIVKPPEFDASKRYPMLLYCQGGPQSMIGQAFSFRWNFHLMASKGYVVAAVNRRGLPGFGQAWNDQISKDWGGQAMADLLSVCDAMQARPYIDKAHTAAVGASFGGYTVYWLMGNGGDRFCSMIAHCGVFNLESMYLTTEEQWFVNWDLGGPFWKSAATEAAYRKFSPHRYVENWKTPLLVIHGEQDFRVPYDQGLQAFTAAQMHGVESRLLMFPGEGHWVMSPQNGVLWQREFFAWLDRHCKPGG